MKETLIAAFWATCFFYAIAFIFSILHKNKAERSAAWVALLANAMVLVVLIMGSGRVPAYRAFESLMLAALVLVCVGIWSSKSEDRLPNLRTWVWLETLLLLGIACFFEKPPPPSGYDYNDPLILLFHLVRVVVVSLTLFSSALYLQSRLDYGHSDTLAIDRAHMGRNFLILSAALFLTAEYIGIHWCLRGWGDFWQWGAGFFQSTIIVIYFMLAVHIPGSNHRPGSWRPLLGIGCGPLVLCLQVIRGML